jgi:hypothetical protein
MFRILVFFRKSGVVKSCGVVSCNISWSHVDWFKFCVYIRIWTSAIIGGWSYWIKNYGVEVTVNDIVTLLNF